MTFKVIRGQGQGHKMTSVPLGTIFFTFPQLLQSPDWVWDNSSRPFYRLDALPIMQTNSVKARKREENIIQLKYHHSKIN